jgi:glycosyltransferase involved in cell wall biosynthesis
MMCCLSPERYEERLPNGITEALGARTPIIASDHPMFAGHLVDGETGMVFPARQPRAMADKIDRLLGDPALYARLSCNATEA